MGWGPAWFPVCAKWGQQTRHSPPCPPGGRHSTDLWPLPDTCKGAREREKHYVKRHRKVNATHFSTNFTPGPSGPFTKSSRMAASFDSEGLEAYHKKKDFTNFFNHNKIYRAVCTTHIVCARERASEFADHRATPEQRLPDVTVNQLLLFLCLLCDLLPG